MSIGDEAPKEWRGSLPVTYRFGPGFSNSNSTVRLEVFSQYVTKKIHNVIGTIWGREEPDRHVLIGNHRDAWLFGAVDPSSGTACLAEISRVVGRLLESGWRPRRTLKFCSWGAEEFGLIGSVEWVEEHAQVLMERAVAYLNTDVAVGGNYVMVAQTCPSLTDVIFDYAKTISDPNASNDEESLYDVMKARLPSSTHPGEPRVLPYLYRSDYLPFFMFAGVPAADFSYFYGGGPQLYPAYHTQDDTFYWMKTFVDPEFEFHRTVAKFEGGLLLKLTDSPLLPMGSSRLRSSLERTIDGLTMITRRANLTKNLPTQHVTKALERFINASKAFECALKKISHEDDAMVLRMFNDQMMQVERAFVNPAMRSSQPMERNLIARENAMGVLTALSEGNREEVEKQVSLLAMALNAAAEIIQPVFKC